MQVFIELFKSLIQFRELLNGIIISIMLFGRKITKRTIQIFLGCLWILDGLLQLQPKMFSKQFSTQVIDAAANGQPHIISAPMNFFAGQYENHIILLNIFVIILQIGIGLLILKKKFTRYGLLLSIPWGLFIWWIGEGFSGIFSGHATMLMGFPGAVLLYVILAIAIYPKKNSEIEKPASWLIYFWGLSWTTGAVYQLLPGQNSISDLSSMIAGNGQGQPVWLYNLDSRVGSLINSLGAAPANSHMPAMTMNQMANMPTVQGSGIWLIILIALAQVIIGICVFLPSKYRNPILYFSIILSLAYWVFGQSFGGIFTGLGTDPNSAILYIVLVIAILPVKFDIESLKNISSKLEKLFV